MLGIGASLFTSAASLLSYVKDNLKIYFDFKSSRAKALEFVGTGSCAFIVGNTDFVNAGTDSNLVLGNGDFTMCGWVKADSLSSHSYMLAIGNNATGKQVGIGFTDENKLFLSAYASPIVYSTASSTLITTGKWTHLAAVYKGGSIDKVDFYLDGVFYETESVVTDIEVGKIIIGAHTGTDGGHWDGNLAQIGIWKRALSASEIQNIVYKTYSDLKGTELTHLVSWYPLDSDVDSEGVTNTYKDSHGDNNGTNDGSELEDGIYGDYSPKKPRGFDNADTAQADLIGSGSSVLNGSSDYISFGINPTGTTLSGNYSITAWIKPGAYSFETLFGSGGTGQDKEDYIQFINTTTMRVEHDGTTGSGTLTHGHTFTTDEWQHFAITRDADNSNTIKVYRDGVAPSGTITGAGTFKPDLFGAANATVEDFFNTSVCQVGMWSKVLTQEEIQSIKEKSYSELSSSEKTNLVSWWGLDSALTATMRTSAGSDAQDMVVADLHNGETLGSELFNSSAYTDNDLYFNPYGSNTASYTSNSVTITRGGGSGSASGALWYFNANTNPVAGYLGVTTEGLTSGAVYKITLDFESDDSNAYLYAYNHGAVASYSTDGNGTKTMYILGPSSGTPTMRCGNLSDGNYIKVSNISIKKVTQNHGFLI